MVTKQLNLAYLGSKINVESFNRVKECYDNLAIEGYFDGIITDKELASNLFIHSIPNDFFEKRNNLLEFLNALPDLTKEKILYDLSVDSISNLKWNEKISNYLISEFGLPDKFKANRKISVDNVNESYKHFRKPSLTFKNLKSYQSKVYHECFDYLINVPFARSILKMPTGSGKTRTSMEIVCQFINEIDCDVLWLANTEELCDQAYAAFNEVWHFLGKKECYSINHIRSNEGLSFDCPSFHVSTIQSFRDIELIQTKLSNWSINEIGLIVVDEAHISIAPTYKKSIETLIENGTRLLGLTATPGRQLIQKNKLDENKVLSDFYFNKIFEIQIDDDINPIEFLRQKGVLANANFHSIEGAIIGELLSRREIENCIETKKIPNKVLKAISDDSGRNARIFHSLIKLIEDGKKVLFFGTSVEHSKMISTLLNIKGFRSAHIDGNTGQFRQKAIRDFRNGNLDILCNFGVLSTGFDDPLIDVVFMARPTNSIVLYSQIIGRGLRGPLIGGTDYCDIYTVIDNINDLPSNSEIYTYFDQYFINSD